MSPREAQVVALLVRGESNKDIAAELGCSVKTVEQHVTHALQKTRAESRSALTARFWSGTHRGP